MKFIIQSLQNEENVVNFCKFIVYFKIDSDPDILELLADQVKKQMNLMNTD